MQNTDSHQTGIHRSGTVTVMIVVVILIISGLTAEYARRVVLERRQVAQELQERQTWELATAGVRRGQLRWQRDAEYTGETWTPSVGPKSQANSSEVVISIQEGSVTVVARYPVNQPRPLQITHQAELEQE